MTSEINCAGNSARSLIHTMFNRYFKSVSLALAVAGAAAVSIVSCSKKVDTASYEQFLGNWAINDICSPYKIPEILVDKGQNSYSMNVTYKMGYLSPYVTATRDSCQRQVTVIGMSNSNAAKNYFSIGNQVVTDNCGHNYTISGGAYLRIADGIANDGVTSVVEVDTLDITIVTTTTGGSSACTYHGYKH